MLIDITGGRQHDGVPGTRGKTRNSEKIGIEVVLRRVGPEETDGGFEFLDLGWIAGVVRAASTAAEVRPHHGDSGGVERTGKSAVGFGIAPGEGLAAIMDDHGEGAASVGLINVERMGHLARSPRS